MLSLISHSSTHTAGPYLPHHACVRFCGVPHQLISEWYRLRNLLPFSFMWSLLGWGGGGCSDDFNPLTTTCCCCSFCITPVWDVSSALRWSTHGMYVSICQSPQTMSCLLSFCPWQLLVHNGNKPWTAVRQLEGVGNGIVKYKAVKGLFWSRLVRESMTNYRGCFSGLWEHQSSDTTLGKTFPLTPSREEWLHCGNLIGFCCMEDGYIKFI